MTNHISAALVTALLLVPACALAAFDTNLTVGARGSAVIELQQFLISRGHLAADNATGYFGPLTLAAVKAFQSSQGILPVSGFFGPLTRGKANALLSDNTPMSSTPETISSLTAQIADLLQKVQQLQTQLANLTTAGSFSAPCDNNTCLNQFSATPTSGPAPLTVQFSASSGGFIDFGDGTSRPMTPSAVLCVQNATNCQSGGTSATHTYASAGTYTAKLIKKAICNAPPGVFCSLAADEVLGTATITVSNSSTGPTLSVLADPSKVSAGHTTWLTWSASSADVCELYSVANSGSTLMWRGGPAGSSTTTAPLASSTDFKLICSWNGQVYSTQTPVAVTP